MQCNFVPSLDATSRRERPAAVTGTINPGEMMVLGPTTIHSSCFLEMEDEMESQTFEMALWAVFSWLGFCSDGGEEEVNGIFHFLPPFLVGGRPDAISSLLSLSSEDDKNGMVHFFSFVFSPAACFTAFSLSKRSDCCRIRSACALFISSRSCFRLLISSAASLLCLSFSRSDGTRRCCEEEESGDLLMLSNSWFNLRIPSSPLTISNALSSYPSPTLSLFISGLITLSSVLLLLPTPSADAKAPLNEDAPLDLSNCFCFLDFVAVTSVSVFSFFEALL
mmetsp:Transcript_26708/g.32392  ORF Transcript_26708/g.32392 Transcript_26708/m.32392 type:complete len:279 (+) Transcript_26708:357-1193(+)